MICSKLLSLLLATTIAIGSEGAEMTGYIVDNQCIAICEGKTDGCAPDGSNPTYTPQLHTGWCKLIESCEESGYKLMSEKPDADGKHTPILSFSGEAAHAAVVDYIKKTNAKDLTFDKKAHFPLVKVVYNDDDFSVTSDGTPPQVVDVSVMDPWSTDHPAYTGADTTQTICNDASEADIDTNNMCFRSDISVTKSDVNDMLIIESGGCPDHGNMKGGSEGTITNNQETVLDFANGNSGGDTCGGNPCGGCGSDKCDGGGGCCGSDKCDGGCCGSNKQCCNGGGCCGSNKQCSAGGCGTKCCGSGGCAGKSCSGGCGSGDKCSGGCSGNSDKQCGGCSGNSDKQCNGCAGNSCGGRRAQSTGCTGCGASCSGGCESKTCSANTCSAGCCSGGCESKTCSAGCCSGGCDGCTGNKCCSGGCCGNKCGDSDNVHGDYDPMYQHYTMMIPMNPGEPGEATPISNEVGLMTNGVLLDTHEQTWSYDMCTGHSDTKRQYHYHLPPTCFLKSMGMTVPDSNWWIHDNGNEVRDYKEMSAQWPSKGSSPVVGYARDGFPIYALYDSAGNLQSSKLYGGELDECNGKDDGNGYGYYITPDPPFVPTCLRGTIGSFSYAPTKIGCPSDGINTSVSGVKSAPDDVSDGVSDDGSSVASYAMLPHKVIPIMAVLAAFFV